jgi:hypothetical protein
MAMHRVNGFTGTQSNHAKVHSMHTDSCLCDWWQRESSTTQLPALKHQ